MLRQVSVCIDSTGSSPRYEFILLYVHAFKGIQSLVITGPIMVITRQAPLQQSVFACPNTAIPEVIRHCGMVCSERPVAC